MKKKKNFLLLLIPSNKRKSFLSMNPGKKTSEVDKYLLTAVYMLIIIGVIVATVLFFLTQRMKEDKNPRMISRSDKVSSDVMLSLDGKEEINLKVFAREETARELEEDFERTEKILDQVVPGENESFEEVRKNLSFPQAIEETGVTISWYTDNYRIIETDGTVNNESLEEPVSVTVTAKLKKQDEIRMYEKLVLVKKRQYTKEEQKIKEVVNQLVELERTTRNENEFEIPEKIGETQIIVKNEDPLSQMDDLTKFFLCLILSILFVSSLWGIKLENDKRKWDRELAREYPEMVSTLAFYCASGLSVRNAWQKLGDNYEKRKNKSHPLVRELTVTKAEFENGCDGPTVFENFGNRIGLVQYKRLGSILSQSIIKGNTDIRTKLFLEAEDALAKEEEKIKKTVEEINTKLLIPMAMMLAEVLAILLVPAAGMM